MKIEKYASFHEVRYASVVQRHISMLFAKNLDAWPTSPCHECLRRFPVPNMLNDMNISQSVMIHYPFTSEEKVYLVLPEKV